MHIEARPHTLSSRCCDGPSASLARDGLISESGMSAGPTSPGGGQTGAPAAGQAGLQPPTEAQSGELGPSGPHPVLLQIRLTDGAALRWALPLSGVLLLSHGVHCSLISPSRRLDTTWQRRVFGALQAFMHEGACAQSNISWPPGHMYCSVLSGWRQMAPPALQK